MGNENKVQKKIAEVYNLHTIIYTMSRIILSIELTKSASLSLDAVCKRTGMTKKEIVARSLSWMALQGPDLQAVILDLVTPQTQSHLLRAAADELDRMAELADALPSIAAKKKKKKTGNRKKRA